VVVSSLGLSWVAFFLFFGSGFFLFLSPDVLVRWPPLPTTACWLGVALDFQLWFKVYVDYYDIRHIRK
jgi:hypothetical protein